MIIHIQLRRSNHNYAHKTNHVKGPMQFRRF